ncbi:MAG TPA: SRPBCC domain-containing protein, partial [Polyangiaceae bacterium]|nr:SRPBCC domain-containing protein [Polyangiaceae bacterium]
TGKPNEQLPSMTMEFTFEPTASGSRFKSVTTFPSVEAMEQLVAMGMVEGSRVAMGQIDAVLDDLRNLSANMKAASEVIDDTHIVVRRTVRGGLKDVWRAFNEKELLRKWMLGPDGWEMPVCEVATEVGGTYRYEWQQVGGENRFGFTGQLLEQEAPRRAVTTEAMIGMAGPPAKNELVLTPRAGRRTQIEVFIEYPSKEIRDMALGTGMVDGMETSYARLESVLQ